MRLSQLVQYVQRRHAMGQGPADPELVGESDGVFFPLETADYMDYADEDEVQFATEDLVDRSDDETVWEKLAEPVLVLSE